MQRLLGSFAKSETLVLQVDGTLHRIEVTDPSMPLLYALRDEIGLANPHFGSPEHPHPLQQAFIDEHATLCGYCMNGWVMTAAALLQQKPHATDVELRDGLTGVKCRCGAHMSILRAIKRVTDAAIANAIFDAAGNRLRRAPFRPERVKAALI